MNSLSEKAWKTSKTAIDAIKKHPFNKELADGSLALDKFAYYIEQDSLYLQDFARALAIIASRLPLEFVRDFLKFSDYTFIAEQEVVHNFFRKTFDFQKTGQLAPATLFYTSYLLQICNNQPVEVAVSSVLPCFWVYREVGLFIEKNHSIEKNPYIQWIKTYSGEEFGDAVQRAIHIFDDLASRTSEEIKKKMIEAFYNSTVLEWHFWNDAYYKKKFDQLS